MSVFQEKGLTNRLNWGIMSANEQKKAQMERVSAHSPLREPRMVERGRYEAAEHGSGAAGVNFLSPRRERPLQRRSMLVLPKALSREGSAKQGGNTDFSVLVP